MSDVAQLGNAGASGAYLSTNENVAITDFLDFITNYIVTESGNLLQARVPLQVINY